METKNFKVLDSVSAPVIKLEPAILRIFKLKKGCCPEFPE
jgi:hypothetical protein